MWCLLPLLPGGGNFPAGRVAPGIYYAAALTLGLMIKYSPFEVKVL
jgi:hypothetical protein